MRKLFATLTILLCFAAGTQAQISFYEGTTIRKYDFPKSDDLVDFTLHYTNTGTEPVVIKWNIGTLEITEGWDYTFCDFGLCYIPPIPRSGQTDPIKPGDTAFFKATVYNGKKDGYFQLCMSYTTQGGTPEQGDICITTATAGTTVGIAPSKRLASGLNVRQNPVTDQLDVTGTQGGAIAIYNMAGQQIERGGLRTDEVVSFNTSDWPEGSYVVVDPATGRRVLIIKK